MPRAKLKDTAFLSSTMRVRALERYLLGRERAERMLEAPTHEEAAKVLLECGYDEMAPVTQQSVEAAIQSDRERLYRLMASICPETRLVDVFRVRYDYHNIKTLIKSEATGENAEALLTDSGRVPVNKLLDIYRNLSFSALPADMRGVTLDARELLARSGDPQRSDFLLDNACMRAMLELAGPSPFLTGYVRLMIDSLNLRSVVRSDRIQKGPDFLRLILCPGGNVEVSRITGLLLSGGQLEDVFSGPLAEAAAVGTPAMRGDAPLTEFEKLCDDALVRYLKKARYIAFGEQPLVGYIAAKEAEATAVRTLMTGRLAGVPADAMRERLREYYE